MIIAAVIINIIGILACGVAAGMNFNSDNDIVGVAMLWLCVTNMLCLIANLGRLF